jgi:hypothetical protein
MVEETRGKKVVSLELDFDILREPWNKYSLKDGSYIKSRFVLLKIKKDKPSAEGEQARYGFKGQNITVVYNVPEELKGPPDQKGYSPEELGQSKQEDIRFDTLDEEWNEYILEDGTSVRIKDTIISVGRTDKTDRDGDPIYLVQHTQLFGVKPRK